MHKRNVTLRRSASSRMVQGPAALRHRRLRLASAVGARWAVQSVIRTCDRYVMCAALSPFCCTKDRVCHVFIAWCTCFMALALDTCISLMLLHRTETESLNPFTFTKKQKFGEYSFRVFLKPGHRCKDSITADVKCTGRVSTGLSWLTVRTSGGLPWTLSWRYEQLLASQGLCCMDFCAVLNSPLPLLCMQCKQTACLLMAETINNADTKCCTNLNACIRICVMKSVNIAENVGSHRKTITDCVKICAHGHKYVRLLVP
jgi:hypothetical protein